MDMIKRLSVVLFWVIKSFISKPKIPPTIKTAILIPKGFMMDKIWIEFVACIDAVAIDIAMLQASNPTISSKATTWRRVFTKSPLAPVCLIVITVDAGAVAAASADKTIEKAKFIFKIKNITIKINKDAIKDSKIVITITLLPFFFKIENLKNSPVLNAIKAKAISERKSIPITIVSGTKLNT